MLDIHTHLLPALDDGVKTMEESIAAIQGLAEFGFTHVIATPHFYPGRYTPSREAIDVALAAVREQLKRQSIAIELLRGRECLFDSDLLTSPDRESFPFEWQGKKFQLIELQQSTVSGALIAYLGTLLRARVTPILAHAERYSRVIRDPRAVAEYADMGFRIQVDLLSFESTAHKKLRSTALALLEAGRIDILATDIHRPSQLDGLKNAFQFLRTEVGVERLNSYFDLR